MKLFNWVQNKLNGNKGNPNPSPNPIPVPCNKNNKIKRESREEFSDWPNGFLSIGTFGNNNNLREPGSCDDPDNVQESPTSSPDLSDFTPEEVGKLQKALTKLLSRKTASQSEKESADLPLERFLNCPSSLEVDRRIGDRFSYESFGDKERDNIERTISIIIGKCKEIRADKSRKDIGKKSMSFLLKKMFVCTGGFSWMPSLRDPLSESRMEKLLRTILRKKIYPRSTSRASCSLTKKYLEDGPLLSSRKEEEKENKDDGSKWDKTDSDYIVLEI